MFVSQRPLSLGNVPFGSNVTRIFSYGAESKRLYCTQQFEHSLAALTSPFTNCEHDVYSLILVPSLTSFFL